jgi:riboflavin transporter FmnP
MNNKINNYKIAYTAVLIALSIVLVLLIRFPIFPSATFLEYDPADIPIFITTFLYGPYYGLIVTLIVSLIQGLTVSASSGWIGIIMHFCATGLYVLVSGFIYRYKHSFKGAIIALLSGIIVWVTAMILMNLILTPLFMGVPIDAVKAMILPVILPFNLIKAGINSFVTLLIYKRLHKLFDFIEKKSKDRKKNIDNSYDQNDISNLK